MNKTEVILKLEKLKTRFEKFETTYEVTINSDEETITIFPEPTACIRNIWEVLGDYEVGFPEEYRTIKLVDYKFYNTEVYYVTFKLNN
ncbi:MAG: hypothetical protein R3Y64_08770 [Peptostreptococcaceae bacterium]